MRFELNTVFFKSFLLLAVAINLSAPTCVWDSDFGFKLNCAFKKAGLFRVRNLGGIKAHASLGFSLGDELGFEQSLTNLDPSRRRSVSVKNGVPPNLRESSPRPNVKMEKRGKQNRIMMRPQPINPRPNSAAMESLSSLHRRTFSTMQPIVVGSTVESPVQIKTKPSPEITMAKPLPMGVPPFKPLPPKDEALSVVPLSTTKKTYAPLQIPQAKGPGLAYQNPVPKHVNDLANRLYPAYNTKKIDDYNSITGYGDDTVLDINKQEINEKIAEIAKAGNISMEAVEAAIALRQQQLLNKYANVPLPSSTTTTTTTTTEVPIVFESEPEPVFVPAPPKKRYQAPATGKVMNAPKEYYPVGYEKNFDDHFQSKVDLPDTSFHCGDQKYFPGLYGDENLGCMVFHVCALTDDGLVMKSFLCPESTLFDQTILKCNWWFYVDCKNTRKLYETNIPVSKSYQLMKALTFFSNYKKEIQEDGERPTNPEDIEGINQAITILENQDNKSNNDQPSVLPTIEVITAQTVDPRNANAYKNNASDDVNPVYNHRTNRNYRNQTKISPENTPLNDTVPNSSEIKPVIVKADIAKSVHILSSSENSFKERNSSVKHATRQRQRPKVSVGRPFSLAVTPYSNDEPISKRTRTGELKTRTTSTTTTIINTTKPTTAATPAFLLGNDSKNLDNIKGYVIEEGKTIEPIVDKEEKLADPSDTQEKILADIQREAEKSPAIKRFHRSSSESANSEEMIIVNNEKVQIVRPKAFARLVGQYPTPTAVIERLDEAILGRPNSSKKETKITIVTPEKTKDSLEVNSQIQKT